MNTLATMPKYDAYKDSGVEWLNDIPSSWNVKPGMIAFTENKRNNKGMKEDKVLSLSYGKIVVKPPEKLTGLVPESFETYQIVEPGDIIVRCMDLQNDKESLRFGLAKNNGIITSAYLNLKVKKGFHSKYLFYYFHSLDITKVIYKFGSGLRQNLSFLDFRRLPIFEIPEEEQIAIADFLDRKTVQIEQAIAIKEKQIALLKERKQILIENAVTHGLDPNVPMKDSGVEWIGEIPEHWDAVAVKRVSKKITDGEHISPIFTDMGMEFLSAKDIREHGVEFPDNKFVRNSDGKKFRKRCNPEKGDLLLVSRGATIGRVTLVNTKKEFCLLGSVILIKPDLEKVNNKYLKYAFSSNRLQTEFLETSDHSAQQAIYLVKVSSVKIPMPSIKEQGEIAEYIDRKLIGLHRVIDLQFNQIEKLKEYKSTLINSAVTGKIKVT